MTSSTPQPLPSTANRYLRESLPDLPNAACRNEEPELFFGPHTCDIQCDGLLGCYEAKGETGRYSRIQTAKAICLTCVDRPECLDWALSTDQPFGVWGGKTERERRNIKRTKGRLAIVKLDRRERNGSDG